MFNWLKFLWNIYYDNKHNIPIKSHSSETHEIIDNISTHLPKPHSYKCLRPLVLVFYLYLVVANYQDWL